MNQPFDIDSCLDCHRGTAAFKAVPSHRDANIQKRLAERAMGCPGVSHSSAHPPDALRGTGAPK